MPRTHILIASPASARENNGNWQTASRWQRFLRADYRVTIAHGWTPDATGQPGAAPAASSLPTHQPATPRPAAPGPAAPDLLIALHARRSAAALAAFKAAYPARPALLVLTGTDLYRDIHQDPAARASLDLADALVVLQPDGLGQLTPAQRTRAHVIYQSASSLRARRAASVSISAACASASASTRIPTPTPARAPLDIAMIGHLRAEKDPMTYMRAAALVTTPGVRLLHVGAALDPALAAAARATQQDHPRYRWLGALPHMAARKRLRRCHAMVIASAMEGGANVIIEAVTSGVPVLASDIGGNRGMLGEDYTGFFPLGDADALARLIERSVRDPRFYARLRRQCAARARLFRPAAERAALLDLVDNLLLSE